MLLKGVWELQRGLYAAAAGMCSLLTRLDVHANNLANVSTTGFRKDVPIQRSFPDIFLSRYRDPAGMVTAAAPVGSISLGAAIEEILFSMQPGELQRTGRPLDLALEGEGFFVLEDAEGEILYTRRGDFVLGADGTLQDPFGRRVLGEEGPLVLSGPPTIAPDGTVSHEGSVVGRLRLRWLPPEALVKVSPTAFARRDGGPEPKVAEVTIRQGYLEMTNVDPVREMVALISVMRAYEAAHRAIRAHDELLDRAVNEIGRA